MSTQEQQITPDNALQIIAQALKEIPLPVESKNPQQLTHSVLSRCVAVLAEAIKPQPEADKPLFHVDEPTREPSMTDKHCA